MFKVAMAAAGLTLAALTLSSCETMSPEECAVADWRGVGYQDGLAGIMRFEQRQSDCAKAGIPADFDAYVRGQTQGLRNYCQPQAGFERALRGDTYNGQCPADLAATYASAHADGSRAYAVLSRLREAESDVSSARYDLDRIDRDIRDRERRLRDEDSLSKEEREKIREEIRGLDRERRRRADDLSLAQSAVSRFSDDVSRVRYELGARWGAW